MKQSKFSLADVLTLISCLIFGFITFLSMNFLTLGNTIKSVATAIVIALVFGLLAFSIKLLKTTHWNFAVLINFERSLLILFLVIAIYILINPFAHFFVVTSQKDVIKEQLISNVTQANNMFVEYDEYVVGRKNSFKSKLEAIVMAEETDNLGYLDCGFTPSITLSGESQIDYKLFALGAKLVPSNYADIKNKSTSWLTKSKSAIDIWNPISVINIVNDTERNISNWNNELISISNFSVQCEDPFEFNFIATTSSLTESFKKKGKPTLTSIIIAVILYILMLLPYIFSLRSTKSSHSVIPFLHRNINSVDEDIDVNY